MSSPASGSSQQYGWAIAAVALLAVLYASAGFYAITQSLFCGQLGPDAAPGCVANLLGTACLPSLLAIMVAAFLLWRRRLPLALAVALLPAVVMLIGQALLALSA